MPERKTGRRGLWIVLLLGLAEIGLRIAGYAPARQTPAAHLEPDSPHLFTADEELSWVQVPGMAEYRFADDRVVRTTHDELRTRIVQPTDQFLDPQPSEELWIVGGAVAYGWGVNDDETAAWDLQSGCPSLAIRNYALPGLPVREIGKRVERELMHQPAPAGLVLIVDDSMLERLGPERFFRSGSELKQQVRSALADLLFSPVRWVGRKLRIRKTSREIDALEETIQTMAIPLTRIYMMEDADPVTVQRGLSVELSSVCRVGGRGAAPQ